MKYFRILLLILFSLHLFSQSNEKLEQKAKAALEFCKKNKMNTSFCFLVDMSVHSGKARFYIYDFKTNTITKSGLVCHGMGKSSTDAKPEYSNEIGSYCTSLGKYKLGKRGYSNWGIHVSYKMHGLEKTNSNALKRQVVLHSYFEIPETDVSPIYMALGWSKGCPVVSNGMMTKIDSLLKKTAKPTLIWVYE